MLREGLVRSVEGRMSQFARKQFVFTATVRARCSSRAVFGRAWKRTAFPFKRRSERMSICLPRSTSGRARRCRADGRRTNRPFGSTAFPPYQSPTPDGCPSPSKSTRTQALMSQNEPSPGENQRLVRRLGLLDATMIVVGSMIGSGIFITSAESSRLIGAPGWLLLAWAVAGLMTITGALCCSELAAMMPRAGGVYVFLREAYGPSLGFLFGWTLFLVIQTGTIAAVAIAFAKFIGVFAPGDRRRIITSSSDSSLSRLRHQSFDRTTGRRRLDPVADLDQYARA